MIATETFANLTKASTPAADITVMLEEISRCELDAQSFRSACLVFSGLADRRAAAVAAKIKLTHPQVMDCSGTGGSGLSHFNTSTAVAFVLSCAGVPVAKFGNRAATSKCGSFDLLEVLGYPVNLNLSLLPELIDETNLAFLFAPQFYPCLERLGEIRRRFGKRTILNYLGPLLNPVAPDYRLMGISNAAVVQPVAETIAGSGTNKRSLLVTSDRGLDEVDVAGLTTITSVQSHRIDRFASAGFSLYRSVSPTASRSALAHFEPESSVRCDSLQEIARVFLSVLSGTAGDTVEVQLVVVNAGAALCAAGKADSLEHGCQRAFDLLKSGAVFEHLNRCRRIYERISR